MEAVGTKTSEGLEAFLELLRESEEISRMSGEHEQEQNDRQQDILHDIELETHDYHEYAKLSKKLRDVRKERRIAKDNQDITAPIVEWAANNHAVIKSLERVLGEIRKRERRLENRIYVPRAKGWKG